jgi:hypothetical protein
LTLSTLQSKQARKVFEQIANSSYCYKESRERVVADLYTCGCGRRGSRTRSRCSSGGGSSCGRTGRRACASCSGACRSCPCPSPASHDNGSSSSEALAGGEAATGKGGGSAAAAAAPARTYHSFVAPLGLEAEARGLCLREWRRRGEGRRGL